MKNTAWHFDLATFVMTTILVPLTIYTGKAILKHLREISGFIIDGLFYRIALWIKHPVAARLSLKRYARLQLADSSRFLPVPSRQDTKLDVDTAFVPLRVEDSTNRQTTEWLMPSQVASRARIIGDPGSGKSSLLKKLYREAAMQALRDPRAAKKLPVLLELRNVRPPRSSRVASVVWTDFWVV